MRRFDVAPLVVFVALAIVAGFNATAGAQQYDMSFAVGWSHIEMDNPQGLLFSNDGAYIDTDFAFHLSPQSPLTVGLGISGSGHFDSEDTSFRINPTTVGTTTLYSDVGFFEIEPRLALAFYTSRSDQTGFFFKPRIGAGLLIDSYSIDNIALSKNGFVTSFQTLNHTGAAFEIRPAIQIGYSWGQAGAGIDLSYMAAWGDFGDFGSTAQEARVGLFYNFKF